MAHEIRLGDDGKLDEVVADHVEHFHLERMDEGAWWMRLSFGEGRGSIDINLYAARPERTKISGRAEEDKPRPPGWPKRIDTEVVKILVGVNQKGQRAACELGTEALSLGVGGSDHMLTAVVVVELPKWREPETPTIEGQVEKGEETS